MSHAALNPEQFHYHFRQAKPKEMDTRPVHELRVYGEHGGQYGSWADLLAPQDRRDRQHHRAGACPA